MSDDKVATLVQPGSVKELLVDLTGIEPQIESMVVSIRYKDGDGDMKWSFIDWQDACLHDVQWRHAFIPGFRDIARMEEDDG